MRQVTWCGGGLLILALGLSAAPAAAEEQPRAAAAAPAPRFSAEGSAGIQTAYQGSTQSVAFGWSPTRRLTLLVSAERSHVGDQIERLPDGYSSERGATEQFLGVGVRYAFFTEKRISPYATAGIGHGISRPNVSDYFRDVKRRGIGVLYYGGGVRIPLRPRIDAFVDARFIMAVEAKTDYFGARLPVRAGVAVRF